MFGYIIPNKPELRVKEYNRYRAVYCGLCRRLKERYGIIGELTLTYDMTFLVMLLSSLYEPEEQIRQCRCAVHPVMPHMEVITECSDYGADINIVLMYYKLMDDYKDDKKWLSKPAFRMLESKVRKIGQQYPRQVRAIRKELQYLSELETKGDRDPAAAARSFGRLLGALFVWKEDLWKQDLYKIGYYMGIYIYLLDAWKDLPEDRKENHYNPLPYDEQTPGREQALRHIQLQVMSRCAMHLERLPFIRDAEIIRNIVYSGVWMSWNQSQKKGCLKHGERSV